MDSFGDHALLCRRDPSSAGFQLRHSLVQQTLGQLLRQAGIIHAVEPQGLRLSRYEGPEFGCVSGLTRPADILLYGWRDDHPYCVDLVGVSPACGEWRDAVSAIAVVEQAKRDKHSEVCASHHSDFVAFGFSTLSSFVPATQELIYRVCRRYRTHARIAEWEAHSQVHRRPSFAVMRGVADQFVGGRLDSFGW